MEGISNIVDYLISDNYNEAKYQWLSLCKPFVKITRNQWNAEGTNKNLGTIPLKQYLKRIYTYTCTSERCPSRQNDVNMEYTSEICLHMPESIVKIQGLELISLAISIWSTGGHGIACKSNFSSIPTDHNNYILVNDCNENRITCFGDITIQSMEFADKPPILVFDMNEDLSSEITSLHQIPKEVHIYDQCFGLAGVTSFIKNRRHYIAYILCHDNGLFYLYDALKCESFGKSAANAMQGEMSLLVHIHAGEKDSLTGK